MSESEQLSVAGAPCLGADGWRRLTPDPLDAACEQTGGDVGAAFASLGYLPWSRTGIPGQGPVPLTFIVYCRSGDAPRFVLQAEGNTGWLIEHVYADDLPIAMQLLARWAPAAQALALVQLASALPQAADGQLPDLANLLTGLGIGTGAGAGVAESLAGNVDRIADRLEDLCRSIDQLGNIAQS